jgi:hypothetical protein
MGWGVLSISCDLLSIIVFLSGHSYQIPKVTNDFLLRETMIRKLLSFCLLSVFLLLFLSPGTLQAQTKYATKTLLNGAKYVGKWNRMGAGCHFVPIVCHSAVSDIFR